MKMVRYLIPFVNILDVSLITYIIHIIWPLHFHIPWGAVGSHCVVLWTNCRFWKCDWINKNRGDRVERSQGAAHINNIPATTYDIRSRSGCHAHIQLFPPHLTVFASCLSMLTMLWCYGYVLCSIEYSWQTYLCWVCYSTYSLLFGNEISHSYHNM